jgi:hypothetical protein
MVLFFQQSKKKRGKNRMTKGRKRLSGCHRCQVVGVLHNLLNNGVYFGRLVFIIFAGNFEK